MADLDGIYRQNADTVYRFIYSRTRSAQVAEELTQETFFRAVGSIDRFDGSCRVATWLCGIARNVMLTYYRSQKESALSLDDIPEQETASAEDTALGKMSADRILDAIERVPEPGNEVLRLRLTGGLSFSQIGDALGQTENWARVTFYRAKLKLVKEIGENE